MKMLMIFLSDGDEGRIKRIRELRHAHANTTITDEQIIRDSIVSYWVISESKEEI